MLRGRSHRIHLYLKHYFNSEALGFEPSIVELMSQMQRKPLRWHDKTTKLNVKLVFPCQKSIRQQSTIRSWSLYGIEAANFVSKPS